MKSLRTKTTTRKKTAKTLGYVRRAQPKKSTAKSVATVPPTPIDEGREDEIRIQAETDALRPRAVILGDGEGGYSGEASVGDIIRNTYVAFNRHYSDGAGSFARDALLAATDDFWLIESALNNDGDGMAEIAARCAARAAERARAAVELDHRLELGLEAEQRKRKVTP